MGEVKRERKHFVTVFVVEAFQDDSTKAHLEFKDSGYAESVIRGLVHSGYEVHVKEVRKTLNDAEYAKWRGVDEEQLAYEEASGRAECPQEVFPATPRRF